MPKFSIRAYYTSTGRFRKISIYGESEEDCCQKMRLQGYVDPFEIHEIYEFATERQVEFLARLGVKVLPDTTKYEASEMIEFQISGDVYPNQGLVEYAMQEGVYVSKHTGEQLLYKRIFETLELPKRISFFIFSVHRDHHKGDNFNLNEHPHKHHFVNFSDQHIDDLTFCKSLKWYSGKDIKHFGDYRESDSEITIRGSSRTYAYKKSFEYLKAKGLVRIKEDRFTKNKELESESNYLGWQYEKAETPNLSGCIFLVILLCSVLFLLYMFFLLW